MDGTRRTTSRPRLHDCWQRNSFLYYNFFTPLPGCRGTAGFFLSKNRIVYWPILRYILISHRIHENTQPRHGWRGSLIGKAVVLKTTASDRLQVRVLSSPPSFFCFLRLGFGFLPYFSYTKTLCWLDFLALCGVFGIAFMN